MSSDWFWGEYDIILAISTYWNFLQHWLSENKLSLKIYVFWIMTRSIFWYSHGHYPLKSHSSLSLWTKMVQEHHQLLLKVEFIWKKEKCLQINTPFSFFLAFFLAIQNCERIIQQNVKKIVWGKQNVNFWVIILKYLKFFYV